jgi:uncharacterized protein YegL
MTDDLRLPAATDAPLGWLLISDGMPTDDYRRSLLRLLDEPWVQRSVRLAIGIGSESNQALLEQFTAAGDAAPVMAGDPVQLERLVRWATLHLTRVAGGAPPPFLEVPADVRAAMPSGGGDLW